MSTSVSNRRLRTVAAGALFGAIAFAGFTGTAHAALQQGTITLNKAQRIPFNSPEQDPNTQEDGFQFQVVNAAGQPVVWQPGQEGDMVLTEPGGVGCNVDNPAPNGALIGCSDLIRFVNVPDAQGAHAEIWIVSDFANLCPVNDPTCAQSGPALIPGFTGGHITRSRGEKDPPVFLSDNTGAFGANAQIGGSTVGHVTVYLNSDNVRNADGTISTTISDRIDVIVPAMNPFAAAGLGVMLAAMGAFFIIRIEKKRALRMI